jgi:hypothetical protein
MKGGGERRDKEQGRGETGNAAEVFLLWTLHLA